jgi:signal transduction histidine kinase
MVDKLLTLARLDPQGTSNSNELTNLSKVAEEQLSELGIEALDKHIELSLDGKCQCCVRGDPSMMGVLIRNLVENAIRYTPEHGTVSMKIDEQENHCDNEKENHCHIVVEDSGPGIPEDQFENVFKRFYRVSEENQKGTGLGLALVQRIIEIHKATIEFGKSDLGGLKVEVCFPKK